MPTEDKDDTIVVTLSTVATLLSMQNPKLPLEFPVKGTPDLVDQSGLLSIRQCH